MTPVSSLERLAAATLLASFTGPDVPDWLRQRVEDGLGGVCLFGSNLTAPGVGGVGAAARVTTELHRARPSLLVALDEEGGAVTRLEAALGSSVPGNAALGAVDDVELTREVAAGLAAQLVEAGVDLDLAPSADVNVDAANPVIGVRSFGADPALVSRHTAAFVQGLQSAGVAACAKHFPGHGATQVDSHLALPTLEGPADVLERRELAPFRAAVAVGVATIMTGHLRVWALDPTEPATLSRPILTGLLRESMRFTGAVVTDALDMEGVGGARAIPANVVRALAAGADLCCLGPDATADLVDACVDAVVGAVRRDALDEGRLIDAAGRVAAIPRPGSGPASAPDAAASGAEAARRALRIEGMVPTPLPGAHVVELRRSPMIAAGEVPWGVASPLADLDPTSTAELLDDPDTLSEALERAAGRPLVIVVRDPQCDTRTLTLLSALVRVRPDAVVVDMGWPVQPLLVDVPIRCRIVTFGPARVSGEAVALHLAGTKTMEGSLRG